MTSIDEEFSGYVNIDNDTFVYNVSDSIVTLLPAQSNLNKIYESFEKVCSRDTNSSEYLFGLDGKYNIAFMRSNAFYFDRLRLNPVIRFATPAIIKASGNASGYFNNLTDEWTKFHAITFYGGNIRACSH